MTETFLTAAEVEHLTGKKRPSAQVRALVSMGIAFARRPDGAPVVARSVIEKAKKPKAEPKWSAA